MMSYNPETKGMLTKKQDLETHNPKVVSSSLTPATKTYITRTVTVLVIFY